MNLIVDIGNTRLKIAVFDKGSLLLKRVYDEFDEAFITSELSTYKDVTACIISNVSKVNNKVLAEVEHIGGKCMILNQQVPLPFINKYESAHTLGFDRIAAIAGAVSLFRGRNTLIIDAGTALTIDLKTENEEFVGGNISPGISMRYKALHNFTANLPLVQQQEFSGKLGINTKEAIANGVLKGILYEVESYIDDIEEQHTPLEIILTGGDADFFENNIKKSIFVSEDLNLIGLNHILLWNKKNG